MIDDAQLISHLTEAGFATQDQLDRGLQLANSEDTTLYDALLRHDLVAEKHVIQVASDVLNVPSIHLASAPPRPEMADYLPRDLAESCQVLPVELIDDDGSGNQALRLAMVDPIDVMAMDEVASHTGLNIRPVLVGPSDLEAALQQLYTSEQPMLVAMGDANGDSWAALFDDDQSDQANKASVEDSAVLSIEMRDRPPTDVFEVVDEDLYGEERFDSFDAPDMIAGSDRTQIGAPINLDEWELDDAFTADDLEEVSSPPPLPDSGKKDPQATVVVEDSDAYEDLANQTSIGLGGRGLAALGLDQFNYDDESEADDTPDEDPDTPDDSDPGLFGQAQDFSASDFESLEEDSDISLEHSIELALELDEPYSPPEISEPELLPELSPDLLDDDDDDSVEFILEEIVEEPSADTNEKIDPSPADSAPADDSPDPSAVFPQGIRAALERAKKKSSDRPKLGSLLNKKEPVQAPDAETKPNEPHPSTKEPPADSSDDTSESNSALGRIALKRIAVPRFKGAVEKRSDRRRDEDAPSVDPATREISADLLADLAQKNAPTAQQIDPNFDQHYLAEALAELLVQKGILTREEIQATIEILKGS